MTEEHFDVKATLANGRETCWEAFTRESARKLAAKAVAAGCTNVRIIVADEDDNELDSLILCEPAGNQPARTHPRSTRRRPRHTNGERTP